MHGVLVNGAFHDIIRVDAVERLARIHGMSSERTPVFWTIKLRDLRSNRVLFFSAFYALRRVHSSCMFSVVSAREFWW